MVLAEKGVTVDTIEVDGNNKPEELLEPNPYGAVPTLLDRDLVLYESMVIMEYLGERFPHPPLLPVYPVARALSPVSGCIAFSEIGARTWICSWWVRKETALTKARKSLRESLMAVSPIFAEKPSS